MEKYLKQLGKDSMVYGIGGILAKSIGFFVLPVYTILFTPSQYGIIEMLSVISSFLCAFIVMGMDSAQSYYFFKEKENGVKEQAKIVTSVLQLRLLIGVIAVMACLSLSGLINEIFFNGKIAGEFFVIAFVGVFFSSIMSQATDVFRLLYKPWSYIMITTINTVLGVGIGIVLITFCGYGIRGYFLGSLIAAVICVAIAWIQLRNYINWAEVTFGYWKKLIVFGLPMMPAGLIMWAMSTTDRWFLNYYHSTDIVGVYAIGAKFAMIVAIAIDIFRKAWWPIAMEAIHDQQGSRLYRIVSRLYLGLGLAGVVALTSISPFVMKWFISADFYYGYRVIGILSFSAVFYGFFLISGIGIWKAEKTWLMTVCLGIGAVCNAVMGAWLIPPYAGEGAAMATVVSMLLSNIFLLCVGNRYYKINFPYKVLLFQIGLAGISVYLILHLYSLFNAAFWVGLLGGCFAFLLVWFTIGNDGIRQAKRFINNIGEKFYGCIK